MSNFHVIAVTPETYRRIKEIKSVDYRPLYRIVEAAVNEFVDRHFEEKENDYAARS